MLHKFINTLFISLFFTAIWFPVLQMKFHMFNQMTDTEKRQLHIFPKVTSNLPLFISEYESYFNDNFGFRTNFISISNRLMVVLFHYSPVQFVVFGKDGWLFHSAGIVDIDKRPPYTTDQIKQIKNLEENEIAYLQKNDTYFLSIIAPNKQTIYPEYLPPSILGITRSVRLDQREKALQEVTDEEVDVRPALLGAKGQHLLYYKTDEHWNSYGSFVAYQEIMRNLVKKFPQLEPLTISDFTIQENPNFFGDLEIALALPTAFPEQDFLFNIKPESKNKITNDHKLQKAIIYYDSFFDPTNRFATSLFLANHFNQVIYIRNNEDFTINYNLILKEKPDVVIYELVERGLEHDVWNETLNYKNLQ